MKTTFNELGLSLGDSVCLLRLYPLWKKSNKTFEVQEFEVYKIEEEVITLRDKTSKVRCCVNKDNPFNFYKGKMSDLNKATLINDIISDFGFDKNSPIELHFVKYFPVDRSSSLFEMKSIKIIKIR